MLNEKSEIRATNETLVKLAHKDQREILVLLVQPELQVHKDRKEILVLLEQNEIKVTREILVL